MLTRKQDNLILSSFSRKGNLFSLKDVKLVKMVWSVTGIFYWGGGDFSQYIQKKKISVF